VTVLIFGLYVIYDSDQDDKRTKKGKKR